MQASLEELQQQPEQNDLDYSPDNPKVTDDQDNFCGVSEEDRKTLVTIITKYREGWAPDRLYRIPVWMKSILFYRGMQVLGWDPSSQTYFDALAWYRQGGGQEAGEADYLEKYINNITQMLGTAYVGIMSQGIPGTTVRPENAEILADVTTAKASQEAVSIIERMNKIRQLVRRENLLLYLYGVYFKYTRIVIDGEFAGYDEEPEFGQISVVKPDRYHCPMCGVDTPAKVQGGKVNAIRACPNCGAQMGPECFYPAEASTDEGIVGSNKIPRAGVRWTVHGPLEIDADPQANSLNDTPLLAFDQEIDIGIARKTFPGLMSRIKEGADVQTTPNASYERLRRNEVYSKGYAYTSDTYQQKITFSQNWLQPDAYYRLGDESKDENGETFADRMTRMFSDGMKVSLLGSEVVHVRPAKLTKEWSCCLLHENCGLYPPSIAENVVPFNERFNDITDLIDDWLQRCAAGLVLYDRTKLDQRQMQGLAVLPGVLNGVTTKGAGVDKPLSEAIMQFRFEIDANAFNYPGMIMQWCYMISGLQPQTFGGGTNDNVDTWRGQKAQLSMANARLRIGFENLKEEHSAAAQNAIEALQEARKRGLIGELFDVVEANGSEFRNKYMDLDKMNGRIRVYPDPDQGLPMTAEELRDMFESLMEQVGENNPIAKEIFDVQANQETILSVMAGSSGLVLPGAAQRARTLQHVNTLLEQDWSAEVDPQTGQQKQALPVVPEKNVDDFVEARTVMKQFRQENSDLAQKNPEGWKRLDAYYEMLKQLEAQDAAEDAQRKSKVAQSGAPAPDPALAAAKEQLLQDAGTAAQALTAIATAPPLPKGAGSANVQAGKELIDSVVKSVQ
jgi:hypothetical protein